MKKIFSLALISLLTLSAFATDYIIEPKADGADPIKSRAIPLRFDASSVWGSVSQQIYLASELTGQGAGAGDINAITFYYSASSNIASDPTARNIQIFLMQIPAEKDAFVVKDNGKSDFLYVSSTNKTAGTRVYNGTLITRAVTTSETKTVKIDFDDSFPWDGSSNLVLTVFDMSTTSNTVSNGGFANIRFLISKTETPRFLSKKWYSTDDDNRAAWIADLSNNLTGREGEYWTSTASAAVATQTANRSYVNKVDFSISTTIPAPENLEADPVGTTTATLNWDEVTGATGYNVRWGKTSGSLDHNQSNVATTSLAISDLDEGETYYFDVQTITAGGTSAFASEANFTTTAVVHSHNDITFSKWLSTTTLPTSGNYYLNSDVVLAAQATLSGDLNLCLNGHSIYTYIYNIVVDDEQILTIYDYEGGGEVSGHYVATFAQKGLISVLYGGTLVLSAGTINNQYDNEYGEGSIAIYSNGTLKLSGAPVITGVTEDIYLGTGKVITIESGKPLTNTTPYVVAKSTTTGDITSGWANMSGANPADYFTSNDASLSIGLVEGEAKLLTILNLTDNADNSSKIYENHNQVRYVATNRSFTAGMYNTICMPFALTSAQIESVFGAGTDVQELSSSTYDGEYIDMYFSPVSAMAANTPYLINPANNVANAAFNGVTIVDATPATVSTSFVDLTGITSITALTASEDRYLLGANNKLGYLEANGNLKGMRAYFDTHNLGGGAAPAKRLRIAPDQSMPSALDEATTDKQVRKHMENGQLIIIRDGKRYNALGAEL